MPIAPLARVSSRAAACLTLLAFPFVGCAQREQAIDTSFLRDLTETRGFSAGRPARISITPNGDAVLFLRSGPRDVVQNLYEMNESTRETRCILRAEDLLGGAKEQLTAEEKAARERSRESRQGLTWYQLSEDGSKILTGLSGSLYVIDRKDASVKQLARLDTPARDARFSPDGRYVSCIRGYDLHVIDLETNEDRALTSDGTQDLSHGVAEFVAAEEMDRGTGYWWTGDSQQIVYATVDQTEVPMRYIADPIHPNEPAQGWRYPNAGAKNAKVMLALVSVTGGEARPIEIPWKEAHYIATVRTGKDVPLTIYVQSRDQKDAVLYKLDAATAELTEILREHDDAWVNIDAHMPQWLDDGSAFLWTSERSGDQQLELRMADGTFARVVPHGHGRFDSVVAIDQKSRRVLLRAAETPGESRLLAVGIDRGEAEEVTGGPPGNHGAVVSRDGETLVITSSLRDGTDTQILYDRGDDRETPLPSEAESPPFVPNAEWTTINVDGRDHEVAILRPRAFRSGTKYPVIESVYGGPGSAVVTSSVKAYLRNQWIADQGFIVVQTDARGTPGRGRDWERAIAGNVIDIPLAEHAAIMQALCKKYDEMDPSRVGITGWSFGGYFSAMAVLKRPDVYKAAVAGAPVTDWHDYDTHYTERYLGMPDANAEGYRVCDASTYADQLSRPLLLIHGTTDDNVYFQHTLKLHDALFKAGKPHELLALSGFTHMVPDPNVSMRLYERIVRFFKTNM